MHGNEGCRNLLATRPFLALTDFRKIRKLFSDENRQIVLKFESVKTKSELFLGGRYDDSQK